MSARRNQKQEAGSTVVEFAIALPLGLLLLALLVQGVFIFSAWLTVSNATREGARFGVPCVGRPVQPCSLMPDGNATSVYEAVFNAAQGIDRSRLTVAVSSTGTTLVVSASYPVPILAPFIESILPEEGLVVTAESAMAIENSTSP